MIGHYLSSNNELCYSNFSSQNRELNGAILYRSTSTSPLLLLAGRGTHMQLRLVVDCVVVAAVVVVHLLSSSAVLVF